MKDWGSGRRKMYKGCRVHCLAVYYSHWKKDYVPISN
jgi:hypothetical protein